MQTIVCHKKRHLDTFRPLLFWALMILSTYGVTATASSSLTRGLTLNEVIHTTLTQQSTISLSREQLVRSEGAIKLSRAEFDWTLESSLNQGANYVPGGTSAIYDRVLSTGYNLSLVKKTDHGYFLESQLQLNRDATDAWPWTGDTPGTEKYSRISFAVVVPIMQGAGKTVVTSRKAAARFDYEAARQELLHTISGTVTEVIAAYWQYVAAGERMQIALAAEERAGSITANTQSLVQADEAPRAEQVSAEANQLEKQISLEHAERSLLEARQTLALLMGVPAAESAGLLLPLDKLPKVAQETAQTALANQQKLIALAGHRGDLIALQQKMRAAEKLVVATRDSLSPRLDLVSGVGYDTYRAGTEMPGTGQNFVTRQQYSDWSVALRFSYPLENNQAEGNYAIAGAQLAESKIRLAELQRSIELSLRTILQAMQHVAQEIATADQAVASYQQAVANEKEKYSMGEATLLDLLFTQDKLEAAQEIRTDAYLSGALLLTRLQFESGSMLACTGEVCTWNPNAAAVLTASQETTR